MKRILAGVVVSFALIAFAQGASAQMTQVLSQIDVTAEVRPQHSVQPGMQMSFGRFYPGVAGGTITVTPDNQRSSTGDIVMFNSWGWSPANFMLEGHPGQTFTYSIPTQVVLNNQNVAGGTLQVDALTTDVASGSTLDPMGMANLNIGATLTVPPGVTYGYYRGTLPITVDFQ